MLHPWNRLNEKILSLFGAVSQMWIFNILIDNGSLYSNMYQIMYVEKTTHFGTTVDGNVEHSILNPYSEKCRTVFTTKNISFHSPNHQNLTMYVDTPDCLTFSLSIDI